VCATVFPALPSDLTTRVARPQSQLAVPARQAEGGLCRPCRPAALDALTLLLDGPILGLLAAAFSGVFSLKSRDQLLRDYTTVRTARL
jgi:hypothetical protein